MKRRRSWTRDFLQHLEKQGESLPLQPIVELCSDRRVWIENHHGVTEYSTERISVAVRYGQINICGVGLRLSRMQGQMLVITGSIESIAIQKGCP